MRVSTYKHNKQEPKRDCALIGNKPLYIAGAFAALITVIALRRNLGVEYMTFHGFGLFEKPSIMPVSAMDWFFLLNRNMNPLHH